MRLSLLLSVATLSSSALARNASNASAATTAAFATVSSTGEVTTRRNVLSTSTTAASMTTSIDNEYPGTAVERMMAVRARVKELAATTNTSSSSAASPLDGTWEEVRRKILWAGGLRDLPTSIPGQGYTGHSFNDYNHVDLTTMRDGASDNENDGAVQGIAIGNQLGNGIRAASLPELGPGGSWSTCAIGCNKDPPQDVAHIQFRSRIAFKLVWAPTENFDSFVLVDDAGKLLAKGKPSDGPDALPSLRDRMTNYKIVQGSKYAIEADKIAKGN
mmetsp:Transcript_26960/g.44906  ORF Transcript_26960/g.44906 Transcript_26960/m.44906 type:complete len:274 (+) Transcript_26960:115-936(+)